MEIPELTGEHEVERVKAKIKNDPHTALKGFWDSSKDSTSKNCSTPSAQNKLPLQKSWSTNLALEPEGVAEEADCLHVTQGLS